MLCVLCRASRRRRGREMMTTCEDGGKGCFDYRSRESVNEAVRQYFATSTLTGNALESSWQSCEEGSPRVQQLLADLEREEKLSRCGCGLPFPELVLGANVLDVGCGAGTDSLILSKLVGKGGRVVGVDFCPELVAAACRFAEKRGDDRVRFACADACRLLEQVKVTKYAPYTIAVANCALSLVVEKAEVLRQIAALLEPSGELYVCDVFVSHDVTDCMRNNPFTWTNCIGGAWRWQEFEDLVQTTGFSSPRLVCCRPLEVSKPLLRKIGDAFNLRQVTDQLRALESMSGFQLCAATYRAFKLSPRAMSSLRSCKTKEQIIFSPPEDSGVEKFCWNNCLIFRAGQPATVPGDVAVILRNSRYAQHFLFNDSEDTVGENSSVCPEAHANPFLSLNNSTKPQAVSSQPSTAKPTNSPIIQRCGPGGACRKALPLNGFMHLNGAASKEIGALLQSSPSLKKLREMIAQNGNKGCGHGGCD